MGPAINKAKEASKLLLSVVCFLKHFYALAANVLLKVFQSLVREEFVLFVNTITREEMHSSASKFKSNNI